MSKKIKFAGMVAAYTVLTAAVAAQILPAIEEPALAAAVGGVLAFVWSAALRLEWFSRWGKPAGDVEGGYKRTFGVRIAAWIMTVNRGSWLIELLNRGRK